MAGRLGSGVGVLAMALVVVMTGCGGDAPGEDPTDAATTSPTDETGPTRTVEPDPSEIEDANVARPEGSGCDPGPGDLPDGLWFGSVVGLTPDELELDLACWFIGEDAALAAQADGEESPPPNDYYVRDESTDVRSVPVDPAATAVSYPTADPTDEESGTVADLVAVAETRGGFPYGVWIEVEDGTVVSLQEQWVP
jgi:hypothetical protein